MVKAVLKALKPVVERPVVRMPRSPDGQRLGYVVVEESMSFIFQ